MSPKTEEASPNPLSRKLQKVLSLKLDQDPDLLIALRGLSGVITTNNLRSRRNLRGDFERRSVALSEELCESFCHVNEIVEKLSTEITSMSDCCQEMSTKLVSARQKMSGLLEKTTQIKHESSSVEMKKEVITAFIGRYHITPHQSSILKHTHHVDQEFFDVLTRVKTIHYDCKVLVQSHQTTGLLIMENMALQQETAYQTLYKWSQNECRRLTSDIPEPPSTLKQAFVMLKDRDTLFRSCLDELGKVRRAALLRMFINSLTKGGPGGAPKPIELSSHDPIRYTGDMLAWLHQSIASERDFLLSLLSCKESAMSALCDITAGICRTLKIRVEQIINNTEECITLLQICNITQFYLSTINSFLLSNSPLMGLISELCGQCTKQFNRHVTLNMSRLTDRNEVPSPDLIPTLAFQEGLHLLKVILNTHDVSVVPNVSPAAAMEQLLGVVIDPLVTLCVHSSSQLDTVDNSVYLINTLTCVLNILSMYENTDSKLQILQQKISEELDKLTALQYEHMLKTVHIPTSIDNVTVERLNIVAPKLDHALCNTELLWIQQCSHLCTLKHRSTVWSKACSLFLQNYDQLYTSPQNQSVLVKTTQQIADLLK